VDKKTILPFKWRDKKRVTKKSRYIVIRLFCVQIPFPVFKNILSETGALTRFLLDVVKR
jgi:hypothetical protein